MIKKLFKIALLSLAALAVMGTMVYASSTAASFSENPISVRSLGLGYCSATVVDSSSIYKNPATLKIYNKHSINTMQGTLHSDVRYFNLSYVNPALSLGQREISLGATYLNTTVDGIEEASYDIETGSATLTGDKLNYSANGYVLSLAADHQKLFYGINLKILTESLAGETATGYGLDAGIIYQANKKTMIGLSFFNLLKPNMSWSTGSENQANRRISLGATYTLNNKIAFFSDLEKVENRNTFLHAGVEYKPLAFFAFRAGYNKETFTLGTGLNYKDISIDYAYVNNTAEDLGNTQYFSATFVFDTLSNIGNIEQELSDEEKLQQAINDRRLAYELANLLVSQNTSAEIEPLPVPEELIIEELKPMAENNEELVFEEISPVIEETIEENEVVIVFNDELTEKIYDYQISLISGRYFRETEKMLFKVFLDNTGTQEQLVTCIFKIYDQNNNLITSLEEQSLQVNLKETTVFYFTYQAENKLAKGSYYIEAITSSETLIKYQKEKFIVR